MKLSTILSKEQSVAAPGFNRWLIPPAALAIHLSIGMAYGFSVFWLPLSKSIGIEAPLSCAPSRDLFSSLFLRSCDWPISMLTWTYTLFFVFLGSSAALFGPWLERNGPRKAGLLAALCWSGGLLIAALGVYLHQIVLLWLGAGVIGGIGLGLGYISPVSTLIKWFPDKRGMATGMAIMGFGGGALVGAPLADRLMRFFSSPLSVGVWQTFLALAGIYLIMMTAGALMYRVPPAGWKPSGWKPKTEGRSARMITSRNVHVNVAWKTPQFWLLWAVLCLNVTAGIGVLGMASPMLQEIFGGRLIGNSLPFSQLSSAQKSQIAAIAAGFTGLLSLFNIGGRFAWSSLSDRIGRKLTYLIFFALGLVLYAAVPSIGRAGNLQLFVLAFCVIVSMYGGGFAAIPAYIADLFGPQMVSAIHGRLLTAWSTAGVLGPLLINTIRETQLARGVPGANAYDVSMVILAGLLAIGFLCNLMIRPVSEKYYIADAGQRPGHSPAASIKDSVIADPGEQRSSLARKSAAPLAAAWAFVGLPLLYGLWTTIQKAALLFK
jgi:MFS family permease